MEDTLLTPDRHCQTSGFLESFLGTCREHGGEEEVSIISHLRAPWKTCFSSHKVSLIMGTIPSPSAPRHSCVTSLLARHSPPLAKPLSALPHPLNRWCYLLQESVSTTFLMLPQTPTFSPRLTLSEETRHEWGDSGFSSGRLRRGMREDEDMGDQHFCPRHTAQLHL